jgi:hypothetical protein
MRPAFLTPRMCGEASSAGRRPVAAARAAAGGNAGEGTERDPKGPGSGVAVDGSKPGNHPGATSSRRASVASSTTSASLQWSCRFLRESLVAVRVSVLPSGEIARVVVRDPAVPVTNRAPLAGEPPPVEAPVSTRTSPAAPVSCPDAPVGVQCRPSAASPAPRSIRTRVAFAGS